MEPWNEIAGSTLLVGLSGPQIDSPTAQRLRQLNPAGVVLFRRNLESPDQTRELLGQLARLLGGPLLLAIDQEGGRVSRLEPWIGPTPTAAALGRMGPRAAGRFGRLTGRALRSLGLNLDFAPVVDLCDPAMPNGIGDRAYSTDAGVASAAAGEFLDGLQAQRVAGCLKHFPGLGSTSVDSHVALPTAKRSLRQFEAEDLVPYRLLGARAASVMISHAHVPALDPQPQLPATLSSSIVTGWLRTRLAYRGLVISDDMEMGAVAPLDASGGAAVAALAAGCDLLLYCADLAAAERAAQAIAEAATEDAAFAGRVRQASASVRAAAVRWAPQPDAAQEGWDTVVAELRAALDDRLA